MTRPDATGARAREWRMMMMKLDDRLVLQEQAVERKYKTQTHARCVAWRIVKDWVRAQLALIESGQATLPQLFLPHAVRADGRTFFEVVAAEPQLLLGRGGE